MKHTPVLATAKTAKSKKALKIFYSVAAAMVMTVICTVVASAAGGTTSSTGADAAWQSTITFFVTWIRRIGWAIAFVGAIMFGLAIKNNDADQKQNSLLTMVAGFVVVALCYAIDMFDIFS